VTANPQPILTRSTTATKPTPTPRRTHTHTPLHRSNHDLDRIPGPWRQALPVVGNVLGCLRPDFHRVLSDWSDEYGGIYRMKFLWHETLVVTGERLGL
jgi:hypothetical protein